MSDEKTAENVGDPFLTIDDPEARTHARAVKERFGRVRVVESPAPACIEMVFRPPTRGEFDSYMDSDKSSTYSRQLTLDCCVYPDNTALKQVFDDYPHLMHGPCGRACIELAGQGKAKIKAL